MDNLIKDIMMSKTIMVGDLEKASNLIQNAKSGLLPHEVTPDFLIIKAGKNTKTTVETEYKIPVQMVDTVDLASLSLTNL